MRIYIDPTGTSLFATQNGAMLLARIGTISIPANIFRCMFGKGIAGQMIPEVTMYGLHKTAHMPLLSVNSRCCVCMGMKFLIVFFMSPSSVQYMS